MRKIRFTERPILVSGENSQVTTIKREDLELIVYIEDRVTVNGGKFYAMAYQGNRSIKWKWYHSFRTYESRLKHIQEWIEAVEADRKFKAELKAERDNFVHSVKVGDLFSYSWGYDQTNVDFFQVVRVAGKSVIIKEIGCKTVEGSGVSHGMADYRTAVKDAFLVDGKELRKVVKPGNYLNMTCGGCSLTDEKKEHYCSWYA